jgi:DNA-binding NtrC family response regulator
MPDILIADDEKNMRFVVGRALRSAGHDVREASSGKEALAALAGQAADLVILDQRMPEMDGLTALSHIIEDFPQTPVIMLTAHGSVGDAVTAMKAGAADYLTKPFDVEELKLAVDKALKIRSLERQVDYLREELDRDYDIAGTVGESPAMKEVLETVRRVAPTDATVMIYGESGTGKELIARAIHEGSLRAGEPFIQLSCAALPETLLESELFGYEKGAFTGATASRPGRFELASGGSLFLDEIGDISLAVQVKLLRVLETMTFERLGSGKSIKVDVRLIGATNRDLQALIKEGHFREDLYYRLNVIPVQMPPLRERRGDIRLLAVHFLHRYGPEKSFTPEALKLLEEYPWPGNVRELMNTVERAAILSASKSIEPGDLPAEVRAGAAPAAGPFSLPAEGVNLDSVEKELMIQALERTGGNRTQAARLLGLSRHTLLYRLEKYGLR